MRTYLTKPPFFYQKTLTVGILSVGLIFSNSVYAQATDGEFIGLSSDEVQIIQGTNPPAPSQNTLRGTAGINNQISADTVPHSGQYYDSDAFVPDASLGRRSAPREVDPRYEPGSRYVVVRKSAGAGSYAAQLTAAQRALSLGRYTSALELYENLYQKNPNKIPVMMGLAVAQQKTGFTESAITTYEEILAKDPKNADALVNMLGLVGTQYPSVAFRKLMDVWEKNPRNAGVAAQLGLTSAELGNADDAIRYLGIAASIEPNNANHLYNMAVVSDRAGQSKMAIDYYQKALEIDIAHGAGRSIPREQVYDRLADLRRL
ncbi:MAG: tetratricopeptide repeat protein [Pseudomonadota bacterium]